FLVAAVLLVYQTDVIVAVDQSRYHRLAGEVHARRIRRRLALPFFADPGEGVAFDQESGALDGGALIADDQARAFEPEGGAPVLKGERGQTHRSSQDQQMRQYPSH